MSNEIRKWEQFEEWLFNNHPNGGRLGSNRDIAAALDISPSEASRRIDGYLDAQRRPDSKTLYVLRRSRGRTTNAIWYSGIRTADARAIGHMYFDDTRRKLSRAVEPDLRRIGQRNPRAAKKAAGLVDAITYGAMHVLQAAVGLLDDDDDDGGSAGVS